LWELLHPNGTLAAMPNATYGALAEFAASRHGVISRKQAAHFGFNPGKISRLKEHGALLEMVPGILVLAGVRSSWRQQCAIVDAAMKGQGAISHRGAARLHELDGFLNLSEIECTTTSRSALRVPEVICHRVRGLEKSDLITIDGITSTGLARTLVDLGSVVGSDRVLQALDDARRRRASLRWIRSTAERLHRPGQRGTGVLLRFLDDIDRGQDVLPGSWFERLIEKCIAAPDLPTVVRQYEIHSSTGAFVARPDFAMPDLLLGFEAHSRQFHFGRSREPLDAQRDLAVAAEGWLLVYLGWHAHQRPDELLLLVRRIVASRRQTLSGQAGKLVLR
jgi:hypothetical protein